MSDTHNDRIRHIVRWLWEPVPLWQCLITVPALIAGLLIGKVI